MESFPSPSHTLDQGGHRAGEAADYGERAEGPPTREHALCHVRLTLTLPSLCSRVAGDQRPAHAQRGARPLALLGRPSGAYRHGAEVSFWL